MAISTGSMRMKRWQRVAVAVILLVAVVTAVLYGLNEVQKRPSIEIGTGQQVSARVEVLSPDQLEQVAGVTIINPAWDMDWAYAKALAQSHLDRNNEALDTYESIVKTGKPRYYLYVDYALTAVRADDPQRGVTLMTEAVAKLEADSTVNARAKEATKVQLNSKIAGFKEDLR